MALKASSSVFCLLEMGTYITLRTAKKELREDLRRGGSGVRRYNPQSS